MKYLFQQKLKKEYLSTEKYNQDHQQFFNMNKSI